MRRLAKQPVRYRFRLDSSLCNVISLTDIVKHVNGTMSDPLSVLGTAVGVLSLIIQTVDGCITGIVST